MVAKGIIFFYLYLLNGLHISNFEVIKITNNGTKQIRIGNFISILR